jgi:hypothetical protein
MIVFYQDYSQNLLQVPPRYGRELYISNIIESHWVEYGAENNLNGKSDTFARAEVLANSENMNESRKLDLLTLLSLH